MSDDEIIERLRKRMDGWSLNDDSAWLKVKVGELRVLFRAYHAQKPFHSLSRNEDTSAVRPEDDK